MSFMVIWGAVLLFMGVLVPLIVGLVLLIVFRVRKKSRPAQVHTVAKPTATEATGDKKSLAQALKDHRIRCNMTQELVAEKLEVSRQAVSKWENGTSEPSTANLIALAQLYRVDLGELLKDVHK